MRQKVQVTLYTKHGCHLCEEARREMLRAGRHSDYTLTEIDIETDPALLARYGWEIPVVTINGVIIFKYRLTAEEFARQIEKAGTV